MQQGISDRQFSRQKHTSGGWQTRQVHSSNPFIRWCAKALSFKHQGVDELAQKCHSCFTVVDFGCGRGTYSFFFQQRCAATIIAIDWSPEALRTIGRPQHGELFTVCADQCCQACPKCKNCECFIDR